MQKRYGNFWLLGKIQTEAPVEVQSDEVGTLTGDERGDLVAGNYI